MRRVRGLVFAGCFATDLSEYARGKQPVQYTAAGHGGVSRFVVADGCFDKGAAGFFEFDDAGGGFGEADELNQFGEDRFVADENGGVFLAVAECAADLLGGTVGKQVHGLWLHVKGVAEESGGLDCAHLGGGQDDLWAVDYSCEASGGKIGANDASGRERAQIVWLVA